MLPYAEKFCVDREVIIPPYETGWKELFERCHVLVTDYSSAAFDLAYLGKPVIYYQFDREEFFRTHTYRKGYFDYKRMGFGEVVTSRRQLEHVLEAYRRGGWKRKEKYSKRARAFFMYSDTGCCGRILKKLLEERDGVSV